MQSRDLDVSTFKEHFDHGQFIYGDTPPLTRDKDIVSAVTEMQVVFNPSLYPDETSANLAKLYLTAHFLTLDLEASESKGQPVYNQTSRSANGVSESLSIPDWMTQGSFALFSTTYYGQKWLALTRPFFGTYIGCVRGGTQP